MVINSHNYHYPDLTHGNTGPANVTITGTPANGKTVCVQTFRCTNGNVTTQ